MFIGVASLSFPHAICGLADRRGCGAIMPMVHSAAIRYGVSAFS